jgi:hypothetical protein
VREVASSNLAVPTISIKHLRLPALAAFLACAPEGRSYLGVKVSYEPTGGIVSWTARVSIARWNLKEAAGKALPRRTEIAYEAGKLIFKVRYLYGKLGCRCGGDKRKGESALPALHGVEPDGP